MDPRTERIGPGRRDYISSQSKRRKTCDKAKRRGQVEAIREGRDLRTSDEPVRIGRVGDSEDEVTMALQSHVRPEREAEIRIRTRIRTRTIIRIRIRIRTW